MILTWYSLLLMGGDCGREQIDPGVQDTPRKGGHLESSIIYC